MAYTMAPTGLAIARDGMKFTLAWKVADDDYDEGQELQYHTNLTGWTDVALEAGATSRTVTLSAASYYPTTADTLTGVYFRVRGKRAATTQNGVTTYYDWSAWTELMFAIRVPKNASVSEELDSSLDNKSTFSWTVEADAQSTRPAVNTEWQTMLIHNCNETDGSKLTWSDSQPEWDTGTGSLNSSKAITEDSTTLAGGSYTRWFRIRARGSGGNSDWKYSKHVYARPYKAEIREVSSAETDTTTTVRVEWASQRDAAHPIDQTQVEWKIATPLANQACPPGDDWTVASTVADTAGTDSVRVVIDSKVSVDDCLWVRVSNTHDRNKIPGDPELVRAGRLATPESLTISNIDSTNYQLDVTVTNASDVPDSKIALIFRGDGQRVVVGVASGTGVLSVTDLQCPKWNDATLIGISAYAFQGTYTTTAKTAGGVTYTIYEITPNMESRAIGSNASIPLAPETVSVTVGKLRTDAIVHWSWTWTDADIAEISWSTTPWAWESTEPPNTYQINDTNVAKWRIRGLTPGETYYIRVRLGKTGDEITWSPYSETLEAGMFTAPDKPTVQLTQALVQSNSKFGVSWAYSSADGVEQASAEVCAYSNTGVTPPEVSWPNRVVARAKAAQSVNVTAADWVPGASYTIRVRVWSKSGLESEWSEPAVIGVPDVLSIGQTITSLVGETITDSSGVTRTVTSLKALPLTVTATPGAPKGGKTTVIIQRAADFTQKRPDGKVTTSYEGEVVAMRSGSGNAQVSIRLKDLIGVLDDGASYILRVIASADPATPAEVDIPFEVHWNEQAKIPTGITTELLTGNAMKLTPAVSSPATGSTCDIYRVTLDGAELIVKDGTWGTAYVDPYPPINGNYRVVYKTKYGDYTTANNRLAMTGAISSLDTKESIIDFNGRQITLGLNLALSHSWVKGFTETTYLGGSVQGDWDLSVKRSGTITAVAITVNQLQKIEALRALAAWTGICHVRTVDGSSFSADIQVSESRSYKTAGAAAEFELKITKVDAETLDGVTYSEWIQ